MLGETNKLGGKLEVTLPRESDLLAPMRTDIAYPGNTEESLVRDRVVAMRAAGVRIDYVSPSLLSQTIPVEDGYTSTSFTLCRLSSFTQIQSVLGHQKKDSPGFILHLVSLQPKDESNGLLLVNGQANIFFVAGGAMTVFNHIGNWDFYAYSSGDSLKWYEGNQVFSRNF